MKQSISALSLIIASTLVSPMTHAKQSWFEVEVVLFERLSEKSKTQFVNRIKHYQLGQSITLQDDAFYGTLPPCPTLSQFERFSLLPKPELPLENSQIDEQADIAQEQEASEQAPQQVQIPVIETDPVSNELQIDSTVEELNVTQCIAPDDSLLRQAFTIRAQRKAAQQLLDTTQSAVDELIVEESTSNSQSLAQQLTTSALNEVTAPETLMPLEDSAQTAQGLINEVPEIVFDPDTFIAYPTTFSFNGTNYQAVAKTPRQYQVPLTIAQTLAEIKSPSEELITESIEESPLAPQLPHDPNGPYLLDEASLQMGQLVKKLRWQKNTKPLLHLGWRQPTFARHLAQPIHLFAGNDLSTVFDQQGQDKVRIASEQAEVETQQQLLTPITATELPLDNSLEITPLAPSLDINDIVAELEKQQVIEDKPLWNFDGMLKIYLNHFLFIEADFDLRKVEQVKLFDQPTQEATLNNVITRQSAPLSLVKNEQLSTPEPTQNFRYVSQLTSHPMKQHRRVRSKEIHYFDHPNLGMIIQIRRFKVPELVDKR